MSLDRALDSNRCSPRTIFAMGDSFGFKRMNLKVEIVWKQMTSGDVSP